jgi:putative salt-induced outer membrane protein
VNQYEISLCIGYILRRYLFMGFGGLGMNYFTKITLLGLFLLSSNVFAQDDEEAEVQTGWTGAGELGFVKTTGNTDSAALNAKLNFVRTGKRWRHRFTGTALTTSENDIKDNERYTVEVQSDRKISKKSWLFGAFRWDADKFGSYDPQTSLTAGYGYQLMKSEKHELKGEIGAGYKRLDERVSNDSTGEFIGRFLLDDSWQVFKTTLWTNRLLVEAGSTNTFTQFNTALNVSMTDRFAIKLGYEVRNNSNVPDTIEDSEKTDTITSVNLVYNF